MLDFELQRCTRRCAKTQRELEPGEAFVSALVRDGAQVKRLDYSESAWTPPDNDVLAWWRSRMPGGGTSPRGAWAPHIVMLELFQRLDGDDEKADVRYVLALLMIRRRILRLEQTEKNEAGEEVLVVYCPRNETEYRVRTAMPSEPRVNEIQAELSALFS
jgi:hypothetical protein